MVLLNPDPYFFALGQGFVVFALLRFIYLLFGVPMKSCSVFSRGETAYDSAAFHVSLNHVNFTLCSYIEQSHYYILSNTKYISVSELSAVFLRN